MLQHVHVALKENSTWLRVLPCVVTQTFLYCRKRECSTTASCRYSQWLRTSVCNV